MSAETKPISADQAIALLSDANHFGNAMIKLMNEVGDRFVSGGEQSFVAQLSAQQREQFFALLGLWLDDGRGIVELHKRTVETIHEGNDVAPSALN